MLSLLHILLAILGLGFLIFIHELGHFWMAIRKGMKVEAFSIGFGKPLLKWQRKGVQWQLGSLPFGGYVRIAGMQREGTQVEGGYYTKTPWQRIQVALAGPLVNLTFAFAVFALLWMLGGREKPFAQFTHRIGVVDLQSELYQKGVRPGDEIVEYNGRAYQGFRDVQIASIMSEEKASIRGYHIDPLSGERAPFYYTLPTYVDRNYPNQDFRTIGVSAPANYLIYRGGPTNAGALAGFQPGDRILWADGEFLYSLSQLLAIANESTTLLTVRRGEEYLQLKVPRVRLGDLRMSAAEKGELDDWLHEASLREKLSETFFIPYNVSPARVIEGRFAFIDLQDQKKAFRGCERCASFMQLHDGDEIIAVDGARVSSAQEFLTSLQQRHVTLLVERGAQPLVAWKLADAHFADFDRSSVEAIITSIGTPTPITEVGDLHLLRPMTPQKAASPQVPKEIASMKDAKLKAIALEQWEASQQRVMLGIYLSDAAVLYNPGPVQQFSDAVSDSGRTLKGLFSGNLSPKYMSGPVGIVRAMELSWKEGIQDALYWLALISFNLGLINLLPIPALDGGHILFSLWEAVVRRPIPPKTMERLVVPFIGLLIAFFLFSTFHDITRLFG